jgi:hypothetical protein
MSNPAVMVCDECKEYFEIGCVGEEEWAKKHVTHQVHVEPETCVIGWFSGYKDAALREENDAKREVKMAFHWKDGWYFERLENGAVRIFHNPTCEKPADTDIEIDADSWASIVASVTRSGENATTFGLAQNLHQV